MPSYSDGNRSKGSPRQEKKSPGEFVTVADREAEASLTTYLEAILPGVPVVGVP